MRPNDIESKLEDLLAAWGILCRPAAKAEFMALLDEAVERANLRGASHDRVKFRLVLNSDQRVSPTVQEMLKSTLGLRLDELPGAGDNYCREVICRPSQFARFMIGRNDIGMRNGFKELDAVLFTPNNNGMSRPPADVSRRHSEYQQGK